mmetsp:Transcript_38837/g.91381  ORF Transcript_38837/g.91381 Transcript_38837/m.91381 type:complete len:155 (-) Transcript_38837:2284-2748(-)
MLWPLTWTSAKPAEGDPFVPHVVSSLRIHAGSVTESPFALEQAVEEAAPMENFGSTPDGGCPAEASTAGLDRGRLDAELAAGARRTDEDRGPWECEERPQQAAAALPAPFDALIARVGGPRLPERRALAEPSDDPLRLSEATQELEGKEDPSAA